MGNLSIQNQRRLSQAAGYLAMVLIVLVIGLPVYWMFFF